jgi:signal transduction histidine kinase
VTTFFALPLKVRNDVIGVLALGSAAEKTLTADVIDTLHVFTKEASIVLDNALLVKQLEQSNLELEKTIGELKNTQSQLVQSEKMASLGQLVAGVAHEINTPAGAINAATSNLIDSLSSVPGSFRILAQDHVTPEDLDVILLIISQLIETISQERKSTIAIRQDTENLEKLLTQEGLTNVRRAAKQIARFHLNAETLQALQQLFKRYNPDHLLDFLERCSKIVNASKDIRMSIEMVTRIVNALKLYSRLDQARVEEIDIHEGIETTLIILQNQLKYGIVVERNFGDIPRIPCYANELNQVWTNIIHNAIQAMNGSGTLTIDTYLLPERKIGIRITDTGPGIPADIQDKIFDPYFTTKDQGEGSGLGLGIARHIIVRHHGEIRVTSKPGKTSFEVLLPISGVQEEYLAQ